MNCKVPGSTTGISLASELKGAKANANYKQGSFASSLQAPPACFPTAEATLAPGEPYHCKKPSAGACSPGCPSGCSPPQKVPPAVTRSATWRDPELLQSAEVSCLWHLYTK